MLYGFLPPGAINSVFAFKANGFTNLAAANVGPLLCVDLNSNGKNNRIATNSGDFAYIPTLYGFISDPDLADSPINHLGFY